MESIFLIVSSLFSSAGSRGIDFWRGYAFRLSQLFRRKRGQSAEAEQNKQPVT